MHIVIEPLTHRGAETAGRLVARKLEHKQPGGERLLFYRDVVSVEEFVHFADVTLDTF